MSYRRILRALSSLTAEEENALFDLFMWSFGGRHLLSYYTIQDYQNSNWYDYDILDSLEEKGLIKQFHWPPGELIIALTSLGRKVGYMVATRRRRGRPPTKRDFESYMGVFRPPPADIDVSRL